MDEYFDSLERDLRNGIDRSCELDRLSEMMNTDGDARIRASWCIAKMGQNKIADRRIIDILNGHFSDDIGEVRENVAWGIGEVAGAGLCDDECVSTIVRLMRDENENVRAMAAWACGRIIGKMHRIDGKMISALRSLENDDSPYVKECVRFAEEKFTSSWRP